MFEQFPSHSEKKRLTAEEVGERIKNVQTFDEFADALKDMGQVPGSEEGKYWDTRKMVDTIRRIQSFPPEQLKNMTLKSPLAKLMANPFTHAGGIRDKFKELLAKTQENL